MWNIVEKQSPITEDTSPRSASRSWSIKPSRFACVRCWLQVRSTRRLCLCCDWWVIWSLRVTLAFLDPITKPSAAPAIQALLEAWVSEQKNLTGDNEKVTQVPSVKRLDWRWAYALRCWHWSKWQTKNWQKWLKKKVTVLPNYPPDQKARDYSTVKEKKWSRCWFIWGTVLMTLLHEGWQMSVFL